MIVAMMRQTRAINALPQNVAEDKGAWKWVLDELRQRVQAVARADEVDRVMEKFNRRRREWRSSNPAEWGKPGGEIGANADLMIPAGREKPAQWGGQGWDTPTSLRAVDATCEAGITDFYWRWQADQEDEWAET